MICPKCKTECDTKEIQDIEIDICPNCEGMWFDFDELRRVKDITDSDLIWMDFELWKHPEIFKFYKKSLICSKCNKKMIACEYGKTGVEIDYCLVCKGIWLDKGEFEKIIESLQKELVSKSAPDYLRASLQEAKELVTGEEGFASEWKDFLKVLKMLEYRVLSNNNKLPDFISSLQI